MSRPVKLLIYNRVIIAFSITNQTGGVKRKPDITQIWYYRESPITFSKSVVMSLDKIFPFLVWFKLITREPVKIDSWEYKDAK